MVKFATLTVTKRIDNPVCYELVPDAYDAYDCDKECKCQML